VLTSLLFGVRPADAATFAVAAGAALLVAVTAAWLPARRASRVDPTRALRGE
jgi:putative ABC transport system permease protein